MIFRICIQSEYFKSVVCHVGEREELMIFSLSFSPFQTQSCVWQKGWMSRQLAGDKLPFWASWLPNDLVLFPHNIFPQKQVNVSGKIFSSPLLLCPLEPDMTIMGVDIWLCFTTQQKQQRHQPRRWPTKFCLHVVSIDDVENKGRVRVPKRMNFRKSDPPPNYIAIFPKKKPI